MNVAPIEIPFENKAIRGGKSTKKRESKIYNGGCIKVIPANLSPCTVVS